MDAALFFRVCSAKYEGLSQEELAAKLHTNRQAVSKWENNNGYPETEKMF